MTEIRNKKLVLFGAGKIGRSFIGQLFSRSGYEVVFVDIDRDLLNKINKKRCYKVIVKSETGEEVLNIENVRGVHNSEVDEVIRELSGADIAALSVGQHGLPSSVPLIARALVHRLNKYGELPIDIIIAENMRDCDIYLLNELKKLLPKEYQFDKLVGLVETSIGKMVPIMKKEDLQDDPLQVFAEPYNILILDKKAFKNPIPIVKGLAPKDNMKAWVDRKLFIHNLGHATVAYLGFLKYPQATYLYEVLDDAKIFGSARQTMLQSAEILLSVYPDEFTLAQLEEHIDDLLKRFRNKALGDTIFRVGCDLYRKLSPNDRFAGVIQLAIKRGKPFDKILYALSCACHFRAADAKGKMYPSDVEFAKQFEEKGIQWVLSSVCGFAPNFFNNLKESKNFDVFTFKTQCKIR